MTGDGASIPVVILRGVFRRCPACGKGKLFDGFFGARDACSVCGCDFRDPRGDTWAILYLSTGAITGLFLALMLLFTPRNLEIGRAVLIPIVVVAFVATIPIRRGFAMAMHFAVRRLFGEND